MSCMDNRATLKWPRWDGGFNSGQFELRYEMEEHMDKNPGQDFNDPDGGFNSRQFELSYEMEEYEQER